MKTYDGLKTPLMNSLNLVAMRRVAEEVELAGKALPCHVVSVSGQIVTVAFDVETDRTLPNVTIPIATSPYFWQPVQKGDLGMTVPADVYLGGVSGLGGGQASLRQKPGNLTALVFLPVANASWAVPNPDQAVVQGPAGVLLRPLGGGSASIDIGLDSMTFSAGGHTISISSEGVVIDGKNFLLHMHGGVQTGGGETGPVT